MSAELVRPKDGRMIAGVCVGIANRFGTTPTIVRAIFLLSLLLPGPQILIYLALWIFIPER
jgi:phage shock protein PspC (stress-responsive transcriptional regulator)